MNKDRTNTLLPPSFRQVPPSLAEGFLMHILKRGRRLLSCVEGRSRAFTKVSLQIQIVEKDWMSMQIFNNRYVVGHTPNMEFAKP
jgi:hypothetical protein